MRVSLSSLCAAVLLVACQPEPSAPLADPVIISASANVAVSRVEGGVRLTNETSEPIAYAVWNSGWLALFAPCIDTGPECLRLAPGESTAVPDSAIDGWVPGTPEAVVRWWHVLPDESGGARAGQIHELLIAL